MLGCVYINSLFLPSINNNNRNQYLKMNLKHINLDYLNEISSGDREMVLDMINIFISEVPVYLSRMNYLLKNKDWETLGKLAHKVKASASIMGMHQVADILKNLELLIKDNKNRELYSSHVRSVEKQFISAI